MLFKYIAFIRLAFPCKNAKWKPALASCDTTTTYSLLLINILKTMKMTERKERDGRKAGKWQATCKYLNLTLLNIMPNKVDPFQQHNNSKLSSGSKVRAKRITYMHRRLADCTWQIGATFELIS